MTDLSQWDFAGSFDQHEASCLVLGLDPAAVTRAEICATPISRHIEDAYYRAFNLVMYEIDPPLYEDEDDHVFFDTGESEEDRLFSEQLEVVRSFGDGYQMRKWSKSGSDAIALQRFSRRTFVQWITANSLPSKYAFVRRTVEQSEQRDDCLAFENPTGLLKKFHAAHVKFWGLYDPSDRSTAPTNDHVTEWLTQQGVSVRTAEVMATMMRPDNFPVGRRS